MPARSPPSRSAPAPSRRRPSCSSRWCCSQARRSPARLLMLGPTLLKLRLGVDEVVTTLLLNFVVLLFVQMMLEGPLKDPMGGGWPQSRADPRRRACCRRSSSACGCTRASSSLFAAASPLHVLDRRARCFGLKIRAVGENAARRRAMRASPVTRVMVARRRCSPARSRALPAPPRSPGSRAISPPTCRAGFGYAGIVVAMIAGLRPLCVVPAAIFIAGIFVGADTMSRDARRLELHRRPHRRALAPLRARRRPVHALPGAAVVTASHSRDSIASPRLRGAAPAFGRSKRSEAKRG